MRPILTTLRPAVSAASRGWFAATAILLLLAGCGGSGSSGFDVVAFENSAIERAIETAMCQDVDGLTICAAGEPPPPTATEPVRTPTPTQTIRSTPTFARTGTPTGTPGVEMTATPTRTATLPQPDQDTPTATPTPTELPMEPNVGTNFGDSTAIPCQPAAEGCVLDFRFHPENIDPSATFWIAVRRVNPGSDWRIFPHPTSVGSADAPAFEQDLDVDFGADAAMYQIAVLVFHAPPGDAPDTVARLGDTAADLAFVTQELTAVDF